MGLFDFFGGGTPAEKAQKLKAKASEKYGDAAVRQKALQQLADMKHADAVPVLLQRFTFAVDPQTTDAEEKQHVFEAIVSLKQNAVAPVSAFLTRSESASSWAVKILAAILPEEQALEVVCGELKRLGTEYTRDPEKKEVLIRSLEGKTSETIGALLVPFLHDMSDDVKMAALKALAMSKFEPAREPLLELLVGDETAKRVQLACLATLADTGFLVERFRGKVEARLTDGFTLDKAGAVKRKG